MEEKYEEMLDTLYSVKSMYEYLPLIISVTVWYKLPGSSSSPRVTLRIFQR